MASTTKRAVRRPGLRVAVAATLALLLGGATALLFAPRGFQAGADSATAGDAVIPAAAGEPASDVQAGAGTTEDESGRHDAAGPLDGRAVGDQDSSAGIGDGAGGAIGGTDGTSGRASGAGGAVSGGGASDPGGGSGGTNDESGPGGTSGTSDGTGGAGSGGGTTAPSTPETGTSGDPTAAAPAPVVPTLDIGLTIDQVGSVLTGNKSVGTVTVKAQNVGPVSLGGTLTIGLPSGVQYDDGLVRGVLGLVGSLVTTGAVQTCSHTATQVVCHVVSLVPGAAASVSIPVAVASGSESARPTASFLLD